MDWLDEAVRHAAPPALGSDPATAEHAKATACAVLAEAPRGTTFLRKLIAGSALGIGIVGLGVTAATAGPAVIDWLGWTPDVVAQRSFELPDGSDLGLCEVFIRVEPNYRDHDVPDEEVDRRTEEARTFLTNHDWDPLIASITADEIEAAYQIDVEQRVAFTDPDSIASGATPPPATYSIAATQVMSHRIGAEFEQAGYLKQGVSLEYAAGPCNDTAEGSAQ
ncbi:hypothetical protein [Agromyces humatus]|uniref:FtsX extracellular domain-containing protein n=1 Tax=Agromyces humatus TaxID=279573 RepID=A0ABN2KWP7_9MICO|nr:hypothetical protein [Agromyces humatus]